MQAKPTILQLSNFALQPSGHLTTMETAALPFEPKRIYWQKGHPSDTIRGKHSHRQDEQIIACLQGSVLVELENTAGDKSSFTLSEAEKGLYIPPMYWRTFIFSKDAILLALSSNEYDEKDYVRDYTEFKNLK